MDATAAEVEAIIDGEAAERDEVVVALAVTIVEGATDNTEGDGMLVERGIVLAEFNDGGFTITEVSKEEIEETATLTKLGSLVEVDAMDELGRSGLVGMVGDGSFVFII